MALSDLILRLGNQAKELETSAAALGAEDDAKVKERAATLHRSLEQLRSSLDEKLDEQSATSADQMAKMRLAVSAHFDSLRADGAARAARDTEDVVEFALHAIQEAEYHLLATANAADELEVVRPAIARVEPTASNEPQAASVKKSNATTKTTQTKAAGSASTKQHSEGQSRGKSPAPQNATGE